MIDMVRKIEHPEIMKRKSKTDIDFLMIEAMRSPPTTIVVP